MRKVLHILCSVGSLLCFLSFFVVPIRMLTREVAVLHAADLTLSSGMINTLRVGKESGSSTDVRSIVAFKNEQANPGANHSVGVRCADTLP